MTAADALDLIREYARLGMVVITEHAAERMAQRRVYRRDLMNALRNAKRCTQSDGDKWKTTGPDVDGDALDVVVAIRSNLIVVTVY